MATASFRSLVFSILIFLSFFFFGVLTAAKKPLWNDEYYSLVYSIEGKSVPDMLSGKINEGNNCPLFYVLQKAQINIFGYQSPQDWKQLHWKVRDIFSQWFLRLQSIAFLALSFAIIFYFFSRKYNLGIGIYALGLMCSTLMVWDHFLEARPYALWFLLSLIQMLIFAHVFSLDRKRDMRYVYALGLTHVFLALTTVMSMVQIIVLSSFFLLYFERKWLLLLFLVVVPGSFIAFYYVHAPHYNFFFVDGPLALISANFSKDRLCVLAILGMFLFWQWKTKKKVHQEVFFFVFSVFMLFSMSLILFKLKCLDTQQGFQISNRYFLSLAPVGIIVMVLSFICLMRCVTHRWAKAIIIAVFFLALLFRLWKTYLLVHNSLGL